MHKALPAMLPALLLLSCQSDEEQYVEAQTPLYQIPDYHITGQASYRERIALQPGFTFDVTLSDVSRADAPAPVIAEVSRKLDGEQVPLQFQIDVKQHKLKTNMRYAVRATLRAPDGSLAWTTDTTHPIDPTLENQDLGVLNMVRVNR